MKGKAEGWEGGAEVAAVGVALVALAAAAAPVDAQAVVAAAANVTEVAAVPRVRQTIATWRTGRGGYSDPFFFLCLRICLQVSMSCKFGDIERPTDCGCAMGLGQAAQTRGYLLGS
jgi:hypothetical protein